MRGNGADDDDDDCHDDGDGYDGGEKKKNAEAANCSGWPPLRRTQG